MKKQIEFLREGGPYACDGDDSGVVPTAMSWLITEGILEDYPPYVYAFPSEAEYVAIEGVGLFRLSVFRFAWE